MIEELKKIENLLFKANRLPFSNIIEDKESQEYLGYDFQTTHLNFKFRKSKITPKKVGQFVTLWKRNLQNTTEPFHENDCVHFYIIATEENEKYGLFLFPKKELIKRQILTTALKEGKRGFRVYPSWSKTENKQAKETQFWQTKYFIDFSTDDSKNIEKVHSIIKEQQVIENVIKGKSSTYSQ